MADSPAPDPFAAPPAAETAPIGRNRQFRLLWTCMLVIGAGNSMLLAVAPPLVRELHLGDSSVGWIFSLSALLWVFASPYWGRLSDNVGRKPTIALGLFAYAISSASFGTAVMLGQSGALTGFALFISLVLARSIFGAFGSASSPSAQAYIADRTTAFERTAQLAGLSSAFAVGQAFGPGLCAWLASHFGAVFPIGSACSRSPRPSPSSCSCESAPRRTRNASARVSANRSRSSLTGASRAISSTALRSRSSPASPCKCSASSRWIVSTSRARSERNSRPTASWPTRSPCSSPNSSCCRASASVRVRL